MKSRDGLIANRRVNRWVWALLGIAALSSVLVYSVVVAQGGETAITNEADLAPASDEQQSSPVTVPDSPEAQDPNLAYTTNGEWVPIDTLGEASSSPEDVGLMSTGGFERHVYLTKANYATNKALTACASGYHTASFWELYDVSNLIYDRGHPAAYNKADSGYGPPSYWNGWVRTGYDSSNSSATGSGNCNTWTSTSSSAHGVSVRLSRTWETAPGDIGPWDATSFTCNFTGPVWCVRN